MMVIQHTITLKVNGTLLTSKSVGFVADGTVALLLFQPMLPPP